MLMYSRYKTGDKSVLQIYPLFLSILFYTDTISLLVVLKYFLHGQFLVVLL